MSLFKHQIAEVQVNDNNDNDILKVSPDTTNESCIFFVWPLDIVHVIDKVSHHHHRHHHHRHRRHRHHYHHRHCHHHHHNNVKRSPPFSLAAAIAIVIIVMIVTIILMFILILGVLIIRFCQCSVMKCAMTYHDDDDSYDHDDGEDCEVTYCKFTALLPFRVVEEEWC